MTDQQTHLLLWVDLETTSLDLDATYILEVGWKFTDLELNPISQAFHAYPEHSVTESFLEEQAADDFVRQMHRTSGLWDARRRSSTNGMIRTRGEIQYQILQQIKSYDAPVTLAGGGVSVFDKPLLRRDYPAVFDALTYYTMDISVVERYISMRTGVMRGSAKSAAHRVIPDINHAIGVAKVINDMIPVSLCREVMEALGKY